MSGVSGHQRRTWLRGVENVQKRYCLTTAARNLGLLMRHFGVGTPYSLQGRSAALRALVAVLLAPLWWALAAAGRRAQLHVTSRAVNSASDRNQVFFNAVSVRDFLFMR